jgi:putative dimethyl sulfoxide reductase chaperone
MGVNVWSDPSVRQAAYSLFAAFLCRPEPDVAGEQAWSCLQQLHRDLGLNAAQELDELGRWLCNGENRLDELRLEHARLFVGPFALPAPPYGSFYRDNRRVMGDSTVEVLQHYREAGLEVAAESVELPDHIAVLLDFLATLCETESGLRQKGKHDEADALRKQHDRFLGEHLLSWVPQFAQAVRENAMLPYYQSVCTLLDACLKAVYGPNGECACS